MEKQFDGDEHLPSSTVPRCRDASTPVSVPTPPPSSSPQTSGFSPILFRNPADRRGAILDEDYEDDLTQNVFRLSTDSGMQCGGDGSVVGGAGEDADLPPRMRHESVGTESGYGSPYVGCRPPAMSEFSFTADSAFGGRNSLVCNFMSTSRSLIGGGIQSRWPIRFQHQKMLALGPFDPPPQAALNASAADSFRSIGSQTDIVGNQSYVISVEDDDVQGVDEDVFSGQDDVFFNDGEDQPESSSNVHQRGSQPGGLLPDVVPAESYDSREDPSWNGGRNRAHSVSFPVSHLDFSQPREIGRYLSRIATDFDQTHLRGRRQIVEQQQQQQASNPSPNGGGGGFFSFLASSGVRRQRSQSASEAPTSSGPWTNQSSVPQTRSVATNAPPRSRSVSSASTSFCHSSTSTQTRRRQDPFL